MPTPRKNDILDQKSRLDLIPPWIILEIGHIFRLGAKKYSTYNYRIYPGLPYSVMLAAAKRHILQFECNENLDKETGKNHLLHALAEIIMVLDSQKMGYSIQDDRVKQKL